MLKIHQMLIYNLEKIEYKLNQKMLQFKIVLFSYFKKIKQVNIKSLKKYDKKKLICLSYK